MLHLDRSAYDSKRTAKKQKGKRLGKVKRFGADLSERSACRYAVTALAGLTTNALINGACVVWMVFVVNAARRVVHEWILNA